MARRPELREIAAAEGGIGTIASSFAGSLLHPGDPILRARGFDLQVYRDVLRDDQVKATFQQRRAALVSREWFVEAASDAPRDREAAEAVEANLGRIRFDRICDLMLYGLFFGWAVGECMWRIADGRVELADVRVRDRARFRFDALRRLLLITRERPQGIPLPERKFWSYDAGADHDDEPYGLGLAHWLFWPVFFKRHGLKFWLIFLEKFGSPTVVGKYPQGATEEERERLLEAAAAVASEAAIRVPEGFELTLLEAARAGTATYGDLYDRMNAAITKIVLSQTMTTDDGSSLSQAQVHEHVRDEVTRADADLLMSSFNAGPVAWLTEWNFPGASPPRVWRRVEDEPDLLPVAQRDQAIASLGYEPTPERVRETYGEGWERVGAAQPPPPAEGGQAFGERCARCGHVHLAEPQEATDSIDDAIDAVLAREGWEPLLAPVIEPVLDLADQAADLADIERRLPELLARMDTNRLAELLARSRFAARLAGSGGAAIVEPRRRR